MKVDLSRVFHFGVDKAPRSSSVDRSSSAKQKFQARVESNPREELVHADGKRLLKHRGGKISTVVSTEREMRVTDSREGSEEHDTLIDDLFQPALEIRPIVKAANPFKQALEASLKQGS